MATLEGSVVFRWHIAKNCYGQQNVVNCKPNEKPNNPFSFNPPTHLISVNLLVNVVTLACSRPAV